MKISYIKKNVLYIIKKIELKISYVLYIVCNHVSYKLVQHFYRMERFSTWKKNYFFLPHENDFFMIAIFVLLILCELRKMYALCNINWLIVRKYKYYDEIFFQFFLPIIFIIWIWILKSGSVCSGTRQIYIFYLH